MQLNNVVLPAPFGPMSPTISHSSTLMSMESSACNPPKRMETLRDSRMATSGRLVGGDRASAALVERLEAQPAQQVLLLLRDAAGEEEQREDERKRGDE